MYNILDEFHCMQSIGMPPTSCNKPSFKTLTLKVPDKLQLYGLLALCGAYLRLRHVKS